MIDPVKKIRAVLSADQQTFVLKIGAWRDRYPITDLQKKIDFYKSLRDRKQGAYSKDYAPTVDVLESLQRRIAEKGDK